MLPGGCSFTFLGLTLYASPFRFSLSSLSPGTCVFKSWLSEISNQHHSSHFYPYFQIYKLQSFLSPPSLPSFLPPTSLPPPTPNFQRLGISSVNILTGNKVLIAMTKFRIWIMPIAWPLFIYRLRHLVFLIYRHGHILLFSYLLFILHQIRY